MALKRKFTELEREELLMEAKNVFSKYGKELLSITLSEGEKDGTEIFC